MSVFSKKLCAAIFACAAFSLAFAAGGDGTADYKAAFADAARGIAESRVGKNTVIACYGFVAPRQKDYDFFVDAFETALLDAGFRELVTRNDIKSLNLEMDFQKSDTVSDESVVSQCARLGAQIVVIGKFSEYDGKGYPLRIKAINVETGRLSFSRSYECEANADFTRRLSGKSKTSGGVSANSTRFRKVGLLATPFEFGADDLGANFGHYIRFDVDFVRHFGLFVEGGFRWLDSAGAELLAGIHIPTVAFRGIPGTGLYVDAGVGFNTIEEIIYDYNDDYGYSSQTGDNDNDDYESEPFSIAAKLGYRFAFGSHFIMDLYVRAGYPILFSGGISAGVRL